MEKRGLSREFTVILKDFQSLPHDSPETLWKLHISNKVYTRKLDEITIFYTASPVNISIKYGLVEN